MKELSKKQFREVMEESGLNEISDADFRKEEISRHLESSGNLSELVEAIHKDIEHRELGQRFAIALSEGDMDAALKEGPNLSAEVRENAVRRALVLNLSHGNVGTSIKIVEVLKPSVGLMNSEELKEAAELAVLSSAERLNAEDIKKIRKTFKLSPKEILSLEVMDSVKDSLFRLSVDGIDKEVFIGLCDALGVPQKRLNEIAKSILLRKIAGGYVESVAKIINACNLSPEYLSSPELIAIAKKALAENIRKLNYGSTEKLLEIFSFSSGLVSSKEVVAAVNKAITTVLVGGKAIDAIKFIEKFKVPREKVLEIAKHAIESNLTRKNTVAVVEIRDTLAIPKKTIIDASKKTIKEELVDGNIEQASRICTALELFSELLAEDSFREDIKQVIASDLTNEYICDAIDVRDRLQLPSDLIEESLAVFASFRGAVAEENIPKKLDLDLARFCCADKPELKKWFEILSQTVSEKSLEKYILGAETSLHDILQIAQVVEKKKLKNYLSQDQIEMILESEMDPINLTELLNAFDFKAYAEEHDGVVAFSSFREFNHLAKMQALNLDEVLENVPEGMREKIRDLAEKMIVPGMDVSSLKEDIRSGYIEEILEREFFPEFATQSEEYPLGSPSILLRKQILNMREKVAVSGVAKNFFVKELKVQIEAKRKEIMDEIKLLKKDEVSEKEAIKIRLKEKEADLLSRNSKGSIVTINADNVLELPDLFSKLSGRISEIESNPQYAKLAMYLKEQFNLTSDDSLSSLQESQVEEALRLIFELYEVDPQRSKKIRESLKRALSEKEGGEVSDAGAIEYLRSEIPNTDNAMIESLLKENGIDVDTKDTIIAQIHDKKDTYAWSCGDATHCCMRYGSRNNYEYIEREDCAYFTISVEVDGEKQIIAQSVLVQSNDPNVFAIDNIEVNQKFSHLKEVIAKAYKDFFAKHYATKRILIGKSYNDDGGLITGACPDVRQKWSPKYGELDYTDCFDNQFAYLFNPEGYDDGQNILGLAQENFKQSPLYEALGRDKERKERLQKLLSQISTPITVADDIEDVAYHDNHSCVLRVDAKPAGYIVAADYIADKEDYWDGIKTREINIVEDMYFLESVPPQERQRLFKEYMLHKHGDLKHKIAKSLLDDFPEIKELLEDGELIDCGYLYNEAKNHYMLLPDIALEDGLYEEINGVVDITAPELIHDEYGDHDDDDEYHFPF